MVSAEALVTMLAWVAANVVFVRWRAGRLARAERCADGTRDWAIQAFVRGSSLLALVLLIALAG